MAEVSVGKMKYWTRGILYKFDLLDMTKIRSFGRFAITFFSTHKLGQTCGFGKRTYTSTTGISFIPIGVKIQFLT